MVLKGLGLLRQKVPSRHLKVPFAASFGWPAFLSHQHQLSWRVLVDVHHPWIRDPASLVLVTDKWPPALAALPAWLGRTLTAPGLLPSSCRMFHGRSPQAQRLLAVPDSVQALMQRRSLASAFDIAEQAKS